MILFMWLNSIERAEHQGCVYIGDARLEKSFITWLDDSIVDNIKVPL